MTEVNYILNTMTDRSLIIIDELCRSTSVEAGAAIAMMICDSLARSRAYTFVTTHFTLLTRLADSFFNIKVWQLETIPSGDPNNPKSMKLDFKFSLVPGATSLRGYGIYMVRGIWPSEVLEYVDYLQEQYTKKNKDPKLPILDKVARLKYDLSCKLNKLKLKKRLTLANLNKRIQEFNSEIQKVGLNTKQHCQNIMEHFQDLTGEASALMDHSIFNASTNSELERDDLSQLYLQNLTGNVSEAEVAGLENLSPMTNQDDAEDSVTSISEAKKRMQEIFSPDTKLDISEMSTSTYQSTDQFLNLEPQVILDCTPSQCSLDLTQEALQHELGQNIQDHSVKDEQAKPNSDQPSYFHDQFPDFQNIFKDSSDADENFVTVSQLSSRELSQKLEAIRNEKGSSARVEEVAAFKHPPPKPEAVPESPFITKFVRPLQDDSRKTSTPLITIRGDTKDAGGTPSVPTPTLSKRYGEVTHVTTPKFSFTIPQDAADLDIASMVEDLESFAEEIENEENEAINEDSKKSPCSDNRGIKNRSTYHQYEPKCGNKYICPVVKIIPGPNNPSSEEDMNYVPNDSDTIVRPVLKIPQQKTFSELKESYSPKIKEKNNHETGHVTRDNSTNLEQDEEKQQKIGSNSQRDTDADIVDKTDSNGKRLLPNEYDSDFSKDKVKIGEPDAKNSNNKNSSECSKKITKMELCFAKEKLRIGKNKLKKLKGLQKIKRKIVKIPRLKGITNKTAAKIETYETVGKELNIRKEDQFKEVLETHSDHEIDKIEEDNKINAKSFEGNETPTEDKQSDSDQLDLEKHKELEKGDIVKLVACENNDKTTTGNTAASSDIEASQKLPTHNEKINENAESKNNANIASDDMNNRNKTMAMDSKEEDNENEAYNHTRTNDINNSEQAINIQETCKSIEPVHSSETKLAKEDAERTNANTFTKNDSIEVITQASVDCNENKSKPNKLVGSSDSVYDTALSDEEFSYSPLASIGDSCEKHEKADTHYRAELIAATSADASPKPVSPKNSPQCDQNTVNQTHSTDYERSTEKILSQSYYEILDETEKLLGNHERKNDSNQYLVQHSTTVVEQRNTETGPALVLEVSYKRSDDILKQSTVNSENKLVDSNNVPTVENNTTTTNGEDVLTKSPKGRSLTTCFRNTQRSSTASDKISETLMPKTTKILQNQSSDCKTDEQNKADKPTRSKRIPTLGIRLQQSVSMATTAKKQTALSQEKRKGSSTPETNGEAKKSKLSTDKSSTRTSISEASRLRNLEGDFTSSSSERKDTCVENELISTSNCENEPIDSSLSEVSRRRNLDKKGTTSTTTSGKEQSSSSKSNSNEQLSVSCPAKQRLKKLKKFDAPLKKRSAEPLFTRSSIDESNSLESSYSKSKDSSKSEKPKKFVYPVKLSQKAIIQEFFEQDRKFYESSGSSADLAKLWEERLKRPPRPTPKQIQQTTCLATIRKTNEGVEVIPAIKKTRPSYNSEKKIFSSLSSSAVNMNIFSDQNAETFDQFIKSDNKDYKSFNFKFEYGEKTVDKSNGYMFDFKQVQSVASEYTPNSQSWTFVRKRSEDSNLVSQVSNCNSQHPFLTPSNDISLTPAGFYKQNKEGILNLLKKYK